MPPSDHVGRTWNQCGEQPRPALVSGLPWDFSSLVFCRKYDETGLISPDPPTPVASKTVNSPTPASQRGVAFVSNIAIMNLSLPARGHSTEWKRFSGSGERPSTFGFTASPRTSITWMGAAAATTMPGATSLTSWTLRDGSTSL